MASGGPDWLRRVVVNVIDNGVPVTNSTSIGVLPGNDNTYEDTSFTSAESPRVLNVEADLGRKAYDGYIINDGAGDIRFEISNDGTTYGAQHTQKSGEAVVLTGRTISKIRLTWVDANCGYRILVV